MIRLRTLGACLIHVDDAVIGPEAERMFGLLLYLTTERGRRTARRTLQELLWPDASEEHGRHNLRQAIYKLRQHGVELGGGARDVQLYADQVAFDPFDALAGDASRVADALLTGELGEYLAGYAPTFSEPYAAWVEAQRAYAHARVARATVAAMLERRARGRWEDVERLAQLCLRYDPLNEEATLALAEATALAGSKARALAILDRYIADLGDGTSIQLPATLLRRRIAERLPDPPYAVPSEACFAGRDESLRYLHDLFGHARAGRGQTCLVVGEPGVGKSRLVAEFARVATLQGALVQQLGCRARDQGRPLSVFVDGVPALLKLPGALGCSPRSMHYLKRLTEVDPVATTPSEDSREAEQLYANVRRAVLDLLDAITGDRTLLLVVEDAHWADAASWDVLRDLIGWCGGRRVLLVLTSRLAEVPNAAVERLPVTVHRLAPLAPDPSAQLLAALLGERQRRPGDAQEAWLLRASGGNPLFLRELAIHWLETGREHAVPPSLAALLRERLARLSALALRALQACAVLGAHATFERLEAVLEYRRYEVLDALQELEAAGLLRAAGGGVASRHELVAEEAVVLLGESARAYLHRRAAVALEPSVVDDAPTDAAVLWACVAHWQAAGEPSRGFAVAISCAAQLLSLGRPVAAADLYDRAVAVASSKTERSACLRGLALALSHSGQWGAACRTLHELLNSIGDDSGDLRGKFEAQLELLHAELQMGANIELLRERAMALVADSRVPPSWRADAATVAIALADHACELPDVERVFALAQHVILNPSVPEAQRLTIEMIHGTARGEFDVALVAARRLISARRDHPSAPELTKALRCAAHVARRAGAQAECSAYALEAVAIAERQQLTTQAIRACGMLADYHYMELELDEAASWLERAQYWAGKADDPVLRGQNAVLATKIELAYGRVDEAQVKFAASNWPLLLQSAYPARMDLLATRLQLRVQSGSECSDADGLDEFNTTYQRLIPFGGLDYAATVRFECESRTDRGSAYAVLTTYVDKQRVDRGAPPAILRRHLTASLACGPE